MMYRYIFTRLLKINRNIRDIMYGVEKKKKTRKFSPTAHDIPVGWIPAGGALPFDFSCSGLGRERKHGKRD